MCNNCVNSKCLANLVSYIYSRTSILPLSNLSQTSILSSFLCLPTFYLVNFHQFLSFHKNQNPYFILTKLSNLKFSISLFSAFFHLSYLKLISKLWLVFFTAIETSLLHSRLLLINSIPLEFFFQDVSFSQIVFFFLQPLNLMNFFLSLTRNICFAGISRHWRTTTWDQSIRCQNAFNLFDSSLFSYA